MKKTTQILMMFILTFLLTTCNTSDNSNLNLSSDSDVAYKLFPTRNMFMFIKLNTSNGKMWQVQWNIENENRFEEILSDSSLVSIEEDERNGRFCLYPTENFYNFILLDQIDGRAWQVQWNHDLENRAVLRIN